MNDDPWNAAALGTAGFFLFLAVLAWQAALTWRARIVSAREAQYQQLAAKYAQLLEDTVHTGRRTAEDLARTRASVASMEKMMREID
ncbi:hypothetical protein [Streptomyces paludis]|uniref:Uncharacterized protein n=1 Tax=Streptomyces paludis TaxID=2282738 RepID=A0A345HW82_9ACTN|nr:hypothetical protein [Streptomyces paludis]AXG80956.1 hypothetical protein DVK44_28495 [Streptomyces paludis]